MNEGMKRIGYVIEEIATYKNLNNAFDQVVRGVKRKCSKEGKWLIENREKYLELIRLQILKSKIIFHGWHEKIIVEAGKERHIQIFCMKDRIIMNAIISVVDKHLRKRFIRTTSSSIKGRGIHELKAYIERDIKNDPDNMKYFYKFDIRKFYDNIPQQLVIECLRKVFKDRKLLEILEAFTKIMPYGLSMGMRSSQSFGNLLLSYVMDHKLKDLYRFKHYYRYCDDGLFGFATKEECWKARDICHSLLAGTGMKIKSNESIFPLENGIDMLGYIIYKHHSRIRKRVKSSFAIKIKRVKSKKRRIALIGSFYGMAKHSDTRHLLRLLLNKNDMKRFSELNICFRDKNGKKKFEAQTVSLSDLEDKEIIIEDFEEGINTKYGKDKTVVLFRYSDDKKETDYKFFTASQTLNDALHQVKDAGEFPFITKIVKSGEKHRSTFKFK